MGWGVPLQSLRRCPVPTPLSGTGTGWLCAAPAEMTDRGQFHWLAIIVVLITAMTFTGKPLQSHYLLMLNSVTLKLPSLPRSLGRSPLDTAFSTSMTTRKTDHPAMPCESSSVGHGVFLGVFCRVLQFSSPRPTGDAGAGTTTNTQRDPYSHIPLLALQGAHLGTRVLVLPHKQGSHE